jgi:peptide/nickel transport system substrate-binding protein
MNRKTRAAFVALTATASLTLAACGGGSTSDDKSDGGSSNGAVLPSSAFAKASYDDVKDGGTLVQALDQLPDNWNYAQADGALGANAVVEYPLTNYTGTQSTPDGEWEVDPNYIESAKVVSENPQKIEVKLNPKAVWSDGTPITYVDAVAFWKAMNGTNPKYQVASDAGWRDISAIDKGSTEYEYTITYKKVNADWPNTMYPQLPASVSSSPELFNTGFTKKMYPSNGPFIVSEIDANAGVVTEIPNPRWWGRKPKLDKLIFRVVSQDSLGQAFANKEIDVLDTAANPDVLAQAMKRPDAEIQKSGGLTWSHLTMNASKGPLADVHVRRAIAAAIDRKTMVGVIQKQLDVTPQVQGSVIFVPGQAGYTDWATKEIPYDLKKSASELKEAGYTKGSDGMYEKDGKPLSLTITVPSDTPTNAQRAQLIQGFLKKAGINVTLDTVPTAKYFDDYINKLNFEMSSFSWQGTGFPVSTTQSLFNPAKSEQNYTGITDERLGGLWEKANAELDPTKRLAIANEIDKTIFEYVPIVTLATTPTIYAVEKGIVNIGASQFQTPPTDYTQVGFKK